MLRVANQRSPRLDLVPIMRPHSENEDFVFLEENFVNDAMLEIDSAGIAAREITC